MASSKCLSLLCLLLFLSLSAEARVSEFFSKASRFDAADPTKATTTTPAKVDDDPNAFPFTPESSGGNGYGLYGHSTQDTDPSAGAGEYYSTDTPAKEFHVGNYEGKGSSHAKEYYRVDAAETKRQPEEVDEFDNKQFAARYPAEKEEYDSREPTTRVDDPTAESYYETTFDKYRPREDDQVPGAGKERAREYDNVDATKEYEVGRGSERRSYTPENKNYGMSDTRKLENGRYFYDVENDHYRGNPYSTATNTNPSSYRKEGFYGAAGENRNEYQDDAYKGAEYQNPHEDDPNGYMP